MFNLNFRKIALFILISGYCFSANASQPTSFMNGIVIHVSDGDTLKIKTARNKIVTIRFYGIDSPEKEFSGRWRAQPYNKLAKNFVSQMVLNKYVSVRLKNEITHNREVGEIFYKGRSVNRELVRMGLAWWNKKYEPFDLDLMRLEKIARSQKMGLWQDSRPIAPWVWRRK